MKYRLLLIATSATLLAGCPIFDEDDDTPPPADTMVSYTVEVRNLTSNQPLSPLAVLAHDADYQMFEIGQPASNALELMAESGDNSELLNDAAVAYSFSGAGVILPSQSDSVTMTFNPDQAQYVSVGSMLVNTNDGFVGETQISLSSLAVGDSMSINMAVWDSGTEANDEAAATVPGPAAGGEGFNSNRDDNDRVSFHAGVISQDDGLAT
ncbi:spondin domain-containing protein, partial [Photobacterium sanctipauli]